MSQNAVNVTANPSHHLVWERRTLKKLTVAMMIKKLPLFMYLWGLQLYSTVKSSLSQFLRTVMLPGAYTKLQRSVHLTLAVVRA